MSAVGDYYAKLEGVLGKSEGLVNALLIGIAVISIILVFYSPSRVLKLGWLAYLVNP